MARPEAQILCPITRTSCERKQCNANRKKPECVQAAGALRKELFNTVRSYQRLQLALRDGMEPPLPPAAIGQFLEYVDDHALHLGIPMENLAQFIERIVGNDAFARAYIEWPDAPAKTNQPRTQD